MNIVGTSPIGSTGLYPSDHAGVVATLALTASHATQATSASTNSLFAAYYAHAEQEIGSLSRVFSANLSVLQPPKAVLDSIDQIFADMV